MYESYAGMKSAFNLIITNLEKGEEYCVLMVGESLYEKRVISFFQTYHKKRIEKGIRIRLLSNSTYRGVVLKSHKYEGMKIRFTKQKLPIGLFIFRDHVMTVMWGEKPAAFVIKSWRNYGYYKEFFEQLWGNSKI
ncbi:Uncharacterised protein [uncultured archaeon]|nr:Uncharacterised protein [uncultured archaeon]